MLMPRTHFQVHRSHAPPQLQDIGGVDALLHELGMAESASSSPCEAPEQPSPQASGLSQAADLQLPAPHASNTSPAGWTAVQPKLASSLRRCAVFKLGGSGCSRGINAGPTDSTCCNRARCTKCDLDIMWWVSKWQSLQDTEPLTG